MDAQAIIEMEGKKTRIVNIKVNISNHKMFSCYLTTSML